MPLIVYWLIMDTSPVDLVLTRHWAAAFSYIKVVAISLMYNLNIAVVGNAFDLYVSLMCFAQ